MNMLAFLGWQELLVIGVVAVLIFGRRLPEVGRDFGKGLLEFKKGLKGLNEDVEDTRQATRDVADDARRAGENSRKNEQGKVS